MKLHLVIVQVFFATIMYADIAVAQCQSDTECMGDQICENGVCVIPPAAAWETEAAVFVPAAEPMVVAPAPQSVSPVPAAPPVVTYTPYTPPAEPIADAPSVYAGGRTIRVDLNLSLFNYTRTKWDVDTDEGVSLSTVTFGPVPSLRLGFGIGFSPNGHVFVGTRVLLGISTLRWKEAGDSSDEGGEHYLGLDYALLPYLEYAFGDGKIKPFIAFEIGLDGTYERWAYENSGGGDESSESIYATNLALVGIGGGVHLFLGSSVSLDLWLLESIGVGALNESSAWESDGYSDTVNDKTFVWRTRTEVFLGLSAWI